jgi:hypothetical protein
MFAEFFESAFRIQELRDGPNGRVRARRGMQR